jgi:hypothetical protein
MDRNVGRTDAIVRLVLGAVLIAVTVAFNAHLLLSLLAALGAIIMIGSAIAGECPFYALIGCNTCSRPKSHPNPRSAHTPHQ